MKYIFKLLLFIFLSQFIFANASVGQKAFDFNLPDLFDAKKTHKMSDFKDKVVLLNIWASWCGGCKDEMPEFFHLQKEYDNKNFVIVTVSIDKKSKKSKKFLRKVEKLTGMTTPFITIWDEKKILSKAYKPQGVPASYLIDKNGKIAKIIIGSFEKKDIEKLKFDIDKLLK